MIPNCTEQSPGHRIRRIDILILPAIFVLTWLFIGVGGEVWARIHYPDQELDRCQINDTPGGRFKPDCHSLTTMFESPWIDSDYNDCGYRSDHSCKAAPAGGLRVAVMGTSIARGYWVPYQESFGGRLERALSARCHRPVDVQNLALANSIAITSAGSVPLWSHMPDRLPEAAALHPDALVLVMSAFDLASFDQMPDDARPQPPHAAVHGLAAVVKHAKDYVANASRLMVVLRHLAYRAPDRYVEHELTEGDAVAYLRPPFSDKWQLRLRVADVTLGRMASAAKAADEPLIVLLMPSRAQAVLSAPLQDRHGTDPFAFGQALGAIAARHGIGFVDMTRVMSREADPAELYYTINGHPNAGGDMVLARAAERALALGVAAFAHCRGERTANAG